MKRFIKIILLLVFPVFVMAQPDESQFDSLQKSLKNAANDTIRMDVYLNMALYYNEINRDSSLFYLANGLAIAQKLNLKLYEAHFFENRGYMLTHIGNYPKALESFLASLKILEDPKSEKYAWNLQIGQNPRNDRLNKLGYLHLTMGHLYGRTNHTDKQISSYQQSMAIAESVQNSELVAVVNMNLGSVYIRLNKLDSALHFVQAALVLEGKYRGGVLNSIGYIYEAKGDYESALDAYQKALKTDLEQNNLTGIAGKYLSLGALYLTLNKLDSSLFYGRKALTTSEIAEVSWSKANAYHLISDVFSNQGNGDSAYIYLKLAMAIRDSLNNAQRENLLAYQSMGFDEQLRLQNLEKEKIQTQNRIRAYSMLAGIAVFMLIAFLLYRNNQNRKKANELLQSQKEEIAEQKTSLEQTLANLQTTQSQLIQSEKMASLGELTAGIAHEIQNPLNFVNNFSELNKELVQEAKEELAKGDIEETKAILNDLEGNSEKINHHGKRADAIVKGMLEHSRTSSGDKVPSDINALADEYLRLAYHGMRARDKSFNASFSLEADRDLPRVQVVPQDMGRVLLNLINNAFQAVHEKYVKTQHDASPGATGHDHNVVETLHATSLRATSLQPTDYQPTVTVTTKNLGDHIEISVRDNGPGVPGTIKDKIFQPFFTTKPTGQGTGLGLSLSYDIVKAHGGELKIDSEIGISTTFIVILNL